MIRPKRPAQIAKMRHAGALTAEVLREVARRVEPGVRTIDLDDAAERLIRAKGAEPLFKGYRGYPYTLCVSVNEEVVHGMPGQRELQSGDIVSVDVGVRLDKWCGDSAVTLLVGEVSGEANALVQNAREALERAVAAMAPGVRLSAVSQAIQTCAESRGYSVVRQFTGHGIGREMHEDPQVPNYVSDALLKNDVVLEPGLVLAIEPMLNLGAKDVKVKKNKWTVVTRDGKRSAHVEHTIAVTPEGHDVLTLP